MTARAFTRLCHDPFVAATDGSKEKKSWITNRHEEETGFYAIHSNTKRIWPSESTARVFIGICYDSFVPAADWRKK